MLRHCYRKPQKFLMTQYSFSEQPVSFSVDGYDLYGVNSIPDVEPRSAVIIVVGGPQFRVGSHRQFVLLARYLAENGVLVLRFDYSGMGYSEGPSKGFYEIDKDISAALNFVQNEFASIEKFYLWGLCDAASALAFYAYRDKRVDGLILLNPWVRSEASHSRTLLSKYYLGRFLSLEAWKELLKSPKKVVLSIGSFINVIVAIIKSKFRAKPVDRVLELSIEDRANNIADSMFNGLSNYPGKVCFILSGNDLTADEFDRVLRSNKWLTDKTNQTNTEIHRIQEANHTFSTESWRSQVERITMEFVK